MNKSNLRAFAFFSIVVLLMISTLFIAAYGRAVSNWRVDIADRDSSFMSMAMGLACLVGMPLFGWVLTGLVILFKQGKEDE